MSSFKKLKLELMEDPAFLEEYVRTKPYAKAAMKIIQLRYDLGLTQSELAEKVGVPQSFISKIESFEHAISITTLEKIARACDKKLNYDFV